MRRSISLYGTRFATETGNLQLESWWGKPLNIKRYTHESSLFIQVVPPSIWNQGIRGLYEMCSLPLADSRLELLHSTMIQTDCDMEKSGLYSGPVFSWHGVGSGCASSAESRVTHTNILSWVLERLATTDQVNNVVISRCTVGYLNYFWAHLESRGYNNILVTRLSVIIVTQTLIETSSFSRSLNILMRCATLHSPLTRKLIGVKKRVFGFISENAADTNEKRVVLSTSVVCVTCLSYVPLDKICRVVQE